MRKNKLRRLRNQRSKDYGRPLTLRLIIIIGWKCFEKRNLLRLIWTRIAVGFRFYDTSSPP